MDIRESNKEGENKDIIVPTVKKAQGRLRDLKIDSKDLNFLYFIGLWPME